MKTDPRERSNSVDMCYDHMVSFCAGIVLAVVLALAMIRSFIECFFSNSFIIDNPGTYYTPSHPWKEGSFRCAPSQGFPSPSSAWTLVGSPWPLSGLSTRQGCSNLAFKSETQVTQDQTEAQGPVTLHVEIAVEVGRAVPVQDADSVAVGRLLVGVQ